MEDVNIFGPEDLILVLKAVVDIHLLLRLISVVDHLLHQYGLVKKDCRVGGDDQQDADQKQDENPPPDAAAENMSVLFHQRLLQFNTCQTELPGDLSPELPLLRFPES